MLAQAARRAGPGLLRVRGRRGSGFRVSCIGLGSEGSGAVTSAGASSVCGRGEPRIAARSSRRAGRMEAGSPAGDERRAERRPHSVPFPSAARTSAEAPGVAGPGPAAAELRATRQYRRAVRAAAGGLGGGEDGQVPPHPRACKEPLFSPPGFRRFLER